MQTTGPFSNIIPELLGSGWLVPKALETNVADYLQQLKEPEPKTFEKIEKLWADYEDDNENEDVTQTLLEGESIWLIDLDSVMWRSSYSRSYGAAYYADTLDKAYADPSCKGVVLRCGACYGGERRASYMVADAVKRRNKPVGAFLDYGTAYSGHYLAICETDFILCSNETDSVGGIGAYIRFENWDGAYKAMGAIIEEVYADSSPEKNKSTREAKKGNLKLLKEEAETIALEFRQRVIEARGDKINEVVLLGGAFEAKQALEYGLIDGIGRMDGAFSRILNLSANYSKPQNTMFGFMKMPKLQALCNVAAADITEAQINEAVAELQGANLGGLVELLQSFGQQQSTSTANVKDSAEYKALHSQLTAAQTKTQELQSKLEGYETPGSEPTKPFKKEEKIENTNTDPEAHLSEADIEMRRIWLAQKGK
ncbi:MAG: S49 family peptidase [Bacteroidetes bacterium]|nr:S49 family peptidase [Bacteroidota bacterium]